MPPDGHAATAKKRKRSLAAMQSFLETLRPANAVNSVDHASAVDVSSSSSNPLLLSAVTRCHERFLRVVAAELAATAAAAVASSCGDDGGGGVRRVNRSHVEAALRGLGMDDILREALESAASEQPAIVTTAAGVLSTTTSSKWKRKQDRRTKQWSEEELAEQERLLASSKQRMG